jgi:tRNA A37 threonylcarbamoyltransferase TsaD
MQNSEKLNPNFLEKNKNDLAASFQEAICDILVKKTLKAVEKF